MKREFLGQYVTISNSLGRTAPSALQIHRALMERPITTAGWLVKKTGITPATVNKCLVHLERLGIVRELTARKRNRLFSYAEYVDIMNQGTELSGCQRPDFMINTSRRMQTGMKT